MSALSYLSPSRVPIRAVLDESPSYSWIALSTTSPVVRTLDWFAFFVGISSPDWESYCTAVSTSDEESGTCVVDAYSMASRSQSYDFFKSS
jgi:hypothetical protein